MSKQRLFSSSFQYKQQDPDYRGQRLDKEYHCGPLEDRRCTDVFCCLLLLILVGGMVFVGYLGFKTGDPRFLASPFDEDKHQCKYDPGYEQYQNIFISFHKNDTDNIGFVCVKQCPKTQGAVLDCKTTSKVPNCSDLYIYQAKTIVNLCYPTPDIAEKFNFDKFMDISTLQEYFSDLQVGWPLILAVFGVSFLLSLLFTVFIRFFAGCFVWSSIILLILLLAGVGTVSFLIGSVQFLKNIFHYNDFPQNLKDPDYQLACAIICWVLCLVTILVVLCMCKQIRISIGILKAAADFTRQQCSALFIPIYVTIMQVIFLTIWLTALLFIYSSKQSDIDPVGQTPFGFVVWNTNIQIYTILYLFGLLWIGFFIEGLGCYWTASTVSIWYFSEGSPEHPILRSICFSLKQLGSIAFGSLLIAVVVFIRMVLQFITAQLKQQTLGLDQQAAPAQFALKCASCCIACFERIVRFLTGNAYIMMAISGKNFCYSAKQSFYLVLRSTAQFAITHGTTKIFILVGKLLIVVISCVCGYLFITQIQPYRYRIYSPVFLTIIFAIVSYPIASAFMSLFEMASNTILMCYCIELDLMNGNNPNALQR